MLRKIIIIVAIVALLLAVLFFSLLCIYTNKENTKDESEIYLDKKEEFCFLAFLFFSSIFSLCLIYNIPFIWNKLCDFLKNILGV